MIEQRQTTVQNFVYLALPIALLGPIFIWNRLALSPTSPRGLLALLYGVLATVAFALLAVVELTGPDVQTYAGPHFLLQRGQRAALWVLAVVGFCVLVWDTFSVYFPAADKGSGTGSSCYHRVTSTAYLFLTSTFLFVVAAVSAVNALGGEEESIHGVNCPLLLIRTND